MGGGKENCSMFWSYDFIFVDEECSSSTYWLWPTEYWSLLKCRIVDHFNCTTFLKYLNISVVNHHQRLNVCSNRFEICQCLILPLTNKCVSFLWFSVHIKFGKFPNFQLTTVNRAHSIIACSKLHFEAHSFHSDCSCLPLSLSFAVSMCFENAAFFPYQFFWLVPSFSMLLLFWVYSFGQRHRIFNFFFFFRQIAFAVKLIG